MEDKDNINYIKSPIFGWIVKYEEENKTLILEKCKHEMFYFQTCKKCGYQKSEKDEKEVKAYWFMDNDFSCQSWIIRKIKSWRLYNFKKIDIIIRSW